MAWLVVCRDVADSGALRRCLLERHLAYIESVMDRIAVAGPLAKTAGGNLAGSFFVYLTDDRAVAESLLQNDPYFEAGLYEEVEFHAFRAAAGSWVGGATWR